MFARLSRPHHRFCLNILFLSLLSLLFSSLSTTHTHTHTEKNGNEGGDGMGEGERRNWIHSNSEERSFSHWRQRQVDCLCAPHKEEEQHTRRREEGENGGEKSSLPFELGKLEERTSHQTNAKLWFLINNPPPSARNDNEYSFVILHSPIASLSLSLSLSPAETWLHFLSHPRVESTNIKASKTKLTCRCSALPSPPTGRWGWPLRRAAGHEAIPAQLQTEAGPSRPSPRRRSCRPATETTGCSFRTPPRKLLLGQSKSIFPF